MKRCWNQGHRLNNLISVCAACMTTSLYSIGVLLHLHPNTHVLLKDRFSKPWSWKLWNQWRASLWQIKHRERGNVCLICLIAGLADKDFWIQNGAVPDTREFFAMVQMLISVSTGTSAVLGSNSTWATFFPVSPLHNLPHRFSFCMSQSNSFCWC